MSDTIVRGTTVTMDRQGRIVLPKAIREEARIEPGRPLHVVVRDGRIELEPTYADVRVVERDGFLVAEAAEPLPPLSEKALRRSKRDLRERRKTW
jgi:AbrB family looped-hinge helix DNA binding protein